MTKHLDLILLALGGCILGEAIDNAFLGVLGMLLIQIGGVITGYQMAKEQYNV